MPPKKGKGLAPLPEQIEKLPDAAIDMMMGWMREQGEDVRMSRAEFKRDLWERATKRKEDGGLFQNQHEKAYQMVKDNENVVNLDCNPPVCCATCFRPNAWNLKHQLCSGW